MAAMIKTVADLIAELQQLPPDAAVVIHDADTDWLLHVKSVDWAPGRDGVVEVRGDYQDRFDDQPPPVGQPPASA